MKSETVELARKIHESESTGNFVEDKLQTDERVLARITDGIYRQPSSALRELIANAYDADATEVVVQTDAPRFGSIRVSDNGLGMSVENLAAVVHQIGGSMKRTADGKASGITNATDVSLSPSGRKLIGKIGSGLFSVAQLTRHFQIVTKRKGDDRRLVADIVLYTYADQIDNTGGNESHDFTSGTVRIWSLPAPDLHSHGTEIHIHDVLPRVKEELQSLGRWRRVESDENPDDRIQRPTYHIGRVDDVNPDELKLDANLPWIERDSPETRFRKLVDVLLFGSCRRHFGTLPNITSNCSAGVFFASPYLHFHDFDFLTFDVLSKELVPVIPNLRTKLIDSGRDFSKSPRFLNPLLLDRQVGDASRINTP